VARNSLPRLDRASLLAATLVAASLNRLFFKMADSVALGGWAHAFGSLFGVSAVIWVALLALIDLGGDGTGERAGRADWWLCGAALASCLMPSGWEAGLALLGLSAIYIFRFLPGTRERRAAAIGLALTGPLIFGPLALTYFGAEMLRLDAAFVALLSGHPSVGNIVEYTDPAMLAEGKQMVIYAGCSSFHNMTLVGVMFAVVTQTINVRLTLSMWLLALAMAGAVMAINVARLTAIAVYPQHYEFLHTGLGGHLFGLAALVAAGAIILVGALRGVEPRHA
jgi:hypothetical protein